MIFLFCCCFQVKGSCPPTRLIREEFRSLAREGRRSLDDYYWCMTFGGATCRRLPVLVMCPCAEDEEPDEHQEDKAQAQEDREEAQHDLTDRGQEEARAQESMPREMDEEPHQSSGSRQLPASKHGSGCAVGMDEGTSPAAEEGGEQQTTTPKYKLAPLYEETGT